MVQRPAVLIVHGAFHPPELYGGLKSELEEAGHLVVIPRLATLGDSPGKTWKDDVAVIHNAVLPLFEEGREVIIASHSYGGVPAAQAIENHGVDDRAREGKKGGFKAAVLMAAFCLPKGLDLYEWSGKQYLHTACWAEPYTGRGVGRPEEGCLEVFFNDIPAGDARRYVGLLQPHSQDAFETKTTFGAADVTIGQTFIICEKDECFPPVHQETMAAAIPGMKTERVDGGHSAYISQAARLAEIISQAS